MAAYLAGEISLDALLNALKTTTADRAGWQRMRTTLDTAAAEGTLSSSDHSQLCAMLDLAAVDAAQAEERTQIDPTLVVLSDDETAAASPSTAVPLKPRATGSSESVSKTVPAESGVSATVALTSPEPNPGRTLPALPPDYPPTVVEPSPPEAVDGVLPIGMPSPARVTGSDWSHPELWTDNSAGPAGIGSIVRNRYHLEEQLGRGGMGTVYKARDQLLVETHDADPYVAIKILNEEFRQHPQSMIALQREAKKAQQLAHPNIVTVHNFDRDGTTVFMTMELLRGESLSEFIERFHTGVSPDEARPIIMAMAEGLAYAHRRNIVHSDFKPGNVFVADDGRVKILDFGIARAAQQGNSPGQAVDSFDAGVLGALTPGYASLEMFQKAPPDPADDVYALAVTAYQLLTGRHPFGRRTAKQALEERVTPAPIRGLSRREWRTIADGLALKRDDRLPDATEFLRRYRGITRFAKAAIAAIAVLSLSAAYFAYDAVQARGPDIPFDELPADTQLAFNQQIESGDAELDIEPNKALESYLDAYDLHPRNTTAERRIDKAVDMYVAGYNWELNTSLDKREAVEFVNAWLSHDYLSQNNRLRTFRDRLQKEGGSP